MLIPWQPSDDEIHALFMTGDRYTVKTGDTLMSIAASYNTDIQTLMRANPSIQDPNKIIVGDVIIIPRAGGELPVHTVKNFLIQHRMRNVLASIFCNISWVNSPSHQPFKDASLVSRIHSQMQDQIA